MKRILRFSLFFILFCLCLSQPRLYPEPYSPFSDAEPEISLDVKDADIKDVIKVFSTQSGLNFIVSESALDRKITLYLDKVPLKNAMDQFFKANNLSYELDKDSNIFIIKDIVKAKVDTVTKVFNLKYASVSSSSLLGEKASQIGCSGSGGGGGESGIKAAVIKVLTSSGTVIEDARTNSLIVTDIETRMPFVAQIIASLDVPVPQVMLEVEMLDVSKSAIDKLGVTWPTTFASLDVGGARSTAFPFFGNKAAQGVTGTHFSTSVLSIIDANLTLDYLKTRTDTKNLARPKILTLNNETAEIKITAQEAVGEKKTTSGEKNTETTEAERFETGISLRITPQINTDTGEITMFIMPSVSEATASGITSSSGVIFYNPEVRSTKTLVRVRDNETIIVGGLISNKTTQEVKKLPILADIPILGALFRHKSFDPNKDRELLVFITPHIIKEDNLGIAKVKQFTLPIREQDIASGIDRQAKINTVLNNFERFAK